MSAPAASSTALEKRKLADALAAFMKRKVMAGSLRCDMSWVWRERRAWNSSSCDSIVPAGHASGPLGVRPKGVSEPVARILFWPSAVEAYAGAWTGPTYVIADRRTYSSAEMFTAVMQDNGIAKIIGTRTAGDGCGFMAQATPVVLTHSRLRFRLPNCIRLRRDGSNEVRGIQPGIAILPTEGESPRARAMRLVATIEADLGAATTKVAAPTSPSN